MNNFTYYSPTLFAFGDGQEKNVGALVRRFGGTKVLLHYGSGSVKRNGVYDAVTASLRESGIPFVELGGVRPNPRSGLVYEGIELCRKENVDFVLAIGGGSVIDSAKAIAVGAVYYGDFWDFFSGKATVEKTLPTGNVLTIAATGSEGSLSCVITKEEGNLKWAINLDVIRPVFSVLNPRFTFSLPPYQTACGITDMFSHILERYFSNTPDVEVTDRLCEALMKTILRAAPVAMAHPEDYAARADLMWCGTQAHNNSCGVGREQDWGSHQIEHELSSLYDCAHGAGLAVVTPAWMKFVYQQDVSRFAQFAVRVFDCEMDFAHPENTALEGIRRLEEFLRSIGMPLTLQELGGKEEDIPAAAAHRALKPNGYPIGNFVKLSQQDVETILHMTVAK